PRSRHSFPTRRSSDLTAPPVFSYDAFPIFWRVAVDARWFVTREGPLRARMLRFFQKEWKTNHRFLDRYSLEGNPFRTRKACLCIDRKSTRLNSSHDQI